MAPLGMSWKQRVRKTTYSAGLTGRILAEGEQA